MAISDNISEAYDKAVDYVLDQAFRLWVWLGKRLDVRIEVQGLPELIEENTRLKAQLAELLQHAGTPQRVIVGGQPTGDNRPNARKLTKREVSEIHELRRMGKTNREIADIYDVNPATVSRIVRGIYYKAAA